MSIDTLASDPRITIRRRGSPNPDGEAVVYWMQRAQRAVDNPALDIAIAVGNELGKPIMVFFGLNPFVVRANLRHRGVSTRDQRCPGRPAPAPWLSCF